MRRAGDVAALDFDRASCQTAPVFAAFLTTVLFSLSAVCGHRSARLLGGTEANFWRVTCATLFLASWSYAFGNGLDGQALPIFVLSGLIGIGLGDVAFFQALPRLGSRLSLLIVQCLTAPFAALIEWTWLGTTLTLWQLLAGVVILCGVGVALSPATHVDIPTRDRFVGSLAGVLAALGGAGGAVLSRKAYAVLAAADESIHPVDAGFQRVLGGGILAAIALLLVKRRAVQFSAAPALPAADKWRRAWFWVVLNSLAGQTLGVSCMQWAFETTPTGIVLPILATAPIVVIPIAYVVDGDRPTPRSIVGGLIAVAGVIALTMLR